MADKDTNYWSQLMGTDENAAHYMESYGEGAGSGTRHLIGTFINDDEEVLDIGCGPAWNFDHFMKYGPKIHGYQGYDYSERFVRTANQRINKEYPNSATGAVNTDTSGYVMLGDCRDIEEPDESWDVVILQDVLEHTNGYEKPVSEALRVAKKRVIVVFWRMVKTKEQTYLNDDGNDGYGAAYDQPTWEMFLDSLPYPWLADELFEAANRKHWLYVIVKDTTV